MDNTVTELGAYHMVANQGKFETQRTNAFQFLVTGLDNLVDVATGEPIVNAAETLRYAIKSIDVPSFSIAPLTIRRGNTEMKFAGTPTFNGGALTLDEFVGIKTYDTLYAWQNLAFNVRTQRTGLMTDYKKTAYLVEYTTDFSKVVRQWKLVGCWVSDLNKTGYNNSQAADSVAINCTIQFDYAIPEAID